MGAFLGQASVNGGRLPFYYNRRGSLTDADTLYDQYFRTGTTKRTKFTANPDLDKLVEEQQKTDVQKKRVAILQEAGKFIMDEALFIPLYNLADIYGVPEMSCGKSAPTKSSRLGYENKVSIPYGGCAEIFSLLLDLQTLNWRHDGFGQGWNQTKNFSQTKCFLRSECVYGRSLPGLGLVGVQRTADDSQQHRLDTLHPYANSSGPQYGIWQHMIEPLVEINYARKGLLRRARRVVKFQGNTWCFR